MIYTCSEQDHKSPDYPKKQANESHIDDIAIQTEEENGKILQK